MSNLIILCKNPVPEKEMREIFLNEIKKQNKPFGIWIKETLGGETETENYDFQAFKGEILHAVRVFPDGREETIRGVDFVGTPLSALDSMMCMGDEVYVDNGFCGAESGVVPVSTVSPSVLMRNLELQAGDRERYSHYTFPMHLEEK
jgi:predicted Zn-dependent protease